MESKAYACMIHDLLLKCSDSGFVGLPYISLCTDCITCLIFYILFSVSVLTALFYTGLSWSFISSLTSSARLSSHSYSHCTVIMFLLDWRSGSMVYIHCTDPCALILTHAYPYFVPSHYHFLHTAARSDGVTLSMVHCVFQPFSIR